MRSRPRLADPRLPVSLSAAAGFGRALPDPWWRAWAAIAGWPRPSMMRWAKRFDKTAKILGLGYPGGPAVERLARGAMQRQGAAAAPAGGQRRAAFLVRRAEKRGDAGEAGSGRAAFRDVNRYSDADIAASFQQAAIDCVIDRTRWRSGRRAMNALVVAGGVAANAAVRAALEALAAGRTACALRRAAAGAVHGQCGDDRLGGDRAPRARPVRPARRGGPSALAARPGSRCAGAGSEGMTKVGVIGAGAWGTALAQALASDGIARCCSGRASRNWWTRSTRGAPTACSCPRPAGMKRSARPAILPIWPSAGAACVVPGAVPGLGARPGCLRGARSRALLQGDRGGHGRLMADVARDAVPGAPPCRAFRADFRP
jgi:hypothetical protein